MAVVPLVTSRKDPAGTAFPVFALGFRPFFLVAGAAAVVLLAIPAGSLKLLPYYLFNPLLMLFRKSPR